MSAYRWRALRVGLGRVVLAMAGGAVFVASASAGQPNGAQAGRTHFESAVIAAAWTNKGGTLADLVVTDERHHVPLAVTDPFSLTLKGGRTLSTGDFRLQGRLREVALPVDAKAARLAERIPGKAVEGKFLSPNGRIAIDWKLVQRDGSDYLREIVTITALNADAPITKVSLFGANAPDAMVDGSVDGSPVVSHDDWLGFEHPMSKADAWRGKVKMWVERTLPLAKGQSVTYSAVIGVAHAGQMRRDFANYIERERAHPYRPFLHYNSWYDIGFFTPYTEAEA
ncbi:MAG TPA: enterotoxin, partial [Rhodanobacteraceae bacterium]|nr:enterotoxin [Rhodanobacteraceae bacterium]